MEPDRGWHGAAIFDAFILQGISGFHNALQYHVNRQGPTRIVIPQTCSSICIVIITHDIKFQAGAVLDPGYWPGFRRRPPFAA